MTINQGAKLTPDNGGAEAFKNQAEEFSTEKCFSALQKCIHTYNKLTPTILSYMCTLFAHYPTCSSHCPTKHYSSTCTICSCFLTLHPVHINMQGHIGQFWASVSLTHSSIPLLGTMIHFFFCYINYLHL